MTDLPEEEMLWKQKAMQSNVITWRAESLHVLLWALGEIPTMLEPTERMDGSGVAECLPGLGETMQPFIQKAKLRPKQEILAELHFYFFLRHFIEEIHEQTGEWIDNIEPILVEERYYALFWIACADQIEWDIFKDEDRID